MLTLSCTQRTDLSQCKSHSLGWVAGENQIVFMGVCGGGLKSEKVSLKQAVL